MHVWVQLHSTIIYSNRISMKFDLISYPNELNFISIYFPLAYFHNNYSSIVPFVHHSNYYFHYSNKYTRLMKIVLQLKIDWIIRMQSKISFKFNTVYDIISYITLIFTKCGEKRKKTNWKTIDRILGPSSKSALLMFFFLTSMEKK